MRDMLCTLRSRAEQLIKDKQGLVAQLLVEQSCAVDAVSCVCFWPWRTRATGACT